MTKEYVCMPGCSGTNTVHMPASCAFIGFAEAFHPLKSPTSDTCDACGAIKTNLIARGAIESGSCEIAAPAEGGCAVDGRPSR